ncbi:MAG: glycosyltransferase [bacterium]|nr:glycosyltransferase [bacterium]
MKMSGPRVLTFNFHEPYICLMARIGVPITVGLYDDPSMARPWQTNFRPRPDGIVLAPEAEWRAGLKSGAFDVLVAHNEMNALKERESGIPSILLCHNRRSFLCTTYEGDFDEGNDKYARLLDILSQTYTFVFISESKREDYRYSGPVIPPGIDAEAFGSYTGEDACVLRVGNAMRERDVMFDVDFQERVCDGFPNRVVGFNAGIPESVPSESFDDLLRLYRTQRCLLHVSREAYEDGYNLSTLEAMACGMPVVSLANPTSPITDGVDGFVSYDADELRERIQALLTDPDLAKAIGERGRETVAETFPMSAFAERWRTVLENTASEGTYRAGGLGGKPSPIPEVPRLGIVLDYAPSADVGVVVKHTLRGAHDVVSVGPSSQREGAQSYRDVRAALPDGFTPGAYLYIDSDGCAQAPDLEGFEGLRMCYLPRSGGVKKPRAAIAERFAFTYVADKAEFEVLARAGVPNVAWMPPGCIASERAPDAARPVDVALAYRPGTTAPALAETLTAQYPNAEIRAAAWSELPALFQRSRVAVIPPGESDLSEYLFEAMAAGALVVAQDSATLRAALEPGVHVITYDTPGEVPALVAQYLNDTETCATIADAGREAALANHTMDRRLAEMLAMALEAVGAFTGHVGEGRFQTGGYYRCPRPELAVQVPRHARRVLDCGCGGGEFGRSLKERGVEEVVGIEVVEQAWNLATTVLDDAILGSIEDLDLPFEDEYFDCVVFGDVLEHLVDPCAALRKVARVLAPDGIIVMSIPNVRFWDVVRMLAEGRWRYDDAGILDRTHLRFFTAVEMNELVIEAGLETLRLEPLTLWAGDNPPRGEDGSLSFGRVTIADVSDAEYQDFITYQYLVVAGKPNADRLSASRRALDARDNDLAYELAEEASGVEEFERNRIMARAIGRLGKLDRAADLYRKALAEREDPETAGELGIVLMAMNQVGDAVPLLDQAVSRGAANDRILGASGLARLTQGDAEQAFELFLQAFGEEFDQGALLVPFVEAGDALGRLEEAVPHLTRFADYYPGNLEAACLFVDVLSRLGRTDEAMERLNAILLFSPDHPEAARLKATIENGDHGPEDTA